MSKSKGKYTIYNRLKPWLLVLIIGYFLSCMLLVLLWFRFNYRSTLGTQSIVCSPDGKE